MYRRALAPVAITIGLLGLVAAGLAVAVVALLAVLFLVRRQAIRDKEEIMSPTMRRVVQALAPMLLAGLGLGVLEILAREHRDSIRLIALWMVLYGGALHAAGFFMRRGLRWLGSIFIFFGGICLCLYELGYVPALKENAHWLMGWAFGVNHLIYGLYLKLTAKLTDEE